MYEIVDFAGNLRAHHWIDVFEYKPKDSESGWKGDGTEVFSLAAFMETTNFVAAASPFHRFIQIYKIFFAPDWK